MISFSITRIILTLRLSMTLLRYFISQAYLVYRLLFSAQYGTVLIISLLLNITVKRFSFSHTFQIRHFSDISISKP